MATAYHFTQVTPPRDSRELCRVKNRVALLEQQISQADFYIGKALECRLDGEIRQAILRIAHETLKGARLSSQ